MHRIFGILLVKLAGDIYGGCFDGVCIWAVLLMMSMVKAEIRTMAICLLLLVKVKATNQTPVAFWEYMFILLRQ